jgi:hypothetical protein
MNSMQAPTRGVILRDLVIFQVKLALDSIKDIFVLQASIVATVIDLILGRRKRTVLLYKVLEFSERIDLWLNLYSAVGAAHDRDGLFGRSQAGTETLLGRLEQMVRKGDMAIKGEHAA